MIGYIVVLIGSMLVGASLAAQHIYFSEPLYWCATSFYAVFATLAAFMQN